jgi:hypothetical protein
MAFAFDAALRAPIEPARSRSLHLGGQKDDVIFSQLPAYFSPRLITSPLRAVSRPRRFLILPNEVQAIPAAIVAPVVKGHQGPPRVRKFIERGLPRCFQEWSLQCFWKHIPRSLVGRFKRARHVSFCRQENRHVRKRVANSNRFDIRCDCGSG